MDRIKLATLWFLDTFFEKYSVLAIFLSLMFLGWVPTPNTIGQVVLFTIVTFIISELIEYIIKKIRSSDIQKV